MEGKIGNFLGILVSTLWSDETLNQINFSFPTTEKKSLFFS